jgi:hypothetical protein
MDKFLSHELEEQQEATANQGRTKSEEIAIFKSKGSRTISQIE